MRDLYQRVIFSHFPFIQPCLQHILHFPDVFAVVGCWVGNTDRSFPRQRVLELSDVGGFHADRAVTFQKFIDGDRMGCSHSETHHLSHPLKTPVFGHS